MNLVGWLLVAFFFSLSAILAWVATRKQRAVDARELLAATKQLRRSVEKLAGIEATAEIDGARLTVTAGAPTPETLKNVVKRAIDSSQLRWNPECEVRLLLTLTAALPEALAEAAIDSMVAGLKKDYPSLKISRG